MNITLIHDAVGHQATTSPPALSKSLALDMYRYLSLTRTLEDWIHYICSNQNPKKPLIIGKGYLSTGQEAVSVGAALTLKPQDWLAQSHRDFGALLVRGMTVTDLLAQYFSKAAGPTKGRDANVHLGNTKKHILGFISHMGAMLPAANGIAWAAKYRGDDAVTLAFFGDGASSQGVVHEAMNYAAVFKLAVVFICNNNHWAISTPTAEQYTIKHLSERAAAYGMPGVTCDGNKVEEVYEAVKTAVDRARSGGGPALVECVTMRMAGHGTHDRYRFLSEEELATWRAKDPILTFEKYLQEHGFGDETYFKKTAEDAQKQVEAATEKVKAWAAPVAEGQEEDVFS